MSSPKLGCCSAIEDCNGAPVARPNETGWRVGAWFRGECAVHGVGLVGAGDGEDDLARAVQGGDAQRNPIDEGLQPGLRRKDSLTFVQCRCIWEERGDVTVLADTEELDVEHGVAELVLVVGCGLLLPELALDAVNSVRVAFEPIEQRAFRQRVVREVVVGGNAAFVAPPDLRLAPVGLALRRFLVRLLGSPAARERDLAAVTRCTGQPLRDGRGYFARVLEDDELDLVTHDPPAANSFERSIAAFLRDRHRRSLRRGGGATLAPPPPPPRPAR